MRFPAELLEEIRTRLPLSAVVGRVVTWDKRKSQFSRGDYWACCPFHQEKTPSFHVDDRKGFFHCFGCGVSGDHFRFLTTHENLPFPEAVERLAAEAGVSLPAPDPAFEAADRRRLALTDIVRLAHAFFQETFRSPVGQRARDYAAGRGLTGATIETFGIAAAPDLRDGLRRHLADAGVPIEAMAEAGLVARPEDGRAPYDRFRDRLIIPIEDARGRLVGFGGRSLDGAREPKYLNSPEGPLFDKSRILFNAHRAADAARRSGRIVVVEGYLDAIALHAVGIGEVTASLGTAFTEHHAALLWRMSDEPIVCFDGDAAGLRAAFRSIDRLVPLLAAGRSFRFAFLPEGQDPDDLARAGGREAIERVLTAARPLVDVLWRRETAQARLDTPERCAQLEARLETVVEMIADPMVKRAYRSDLRNRFFGLMRDLRGRSAGRADGNARSRPGVGKARSNTMPNRNPGGFGAGGSATWDTTTSNGISATTAPPDRPLAELERLVLGLAIARPALFEAHAERLAALLWSGRDHAEFLADAIAAVHHGTTPCTGPEDLAARLPAAAGPMLQVLYGEPGAGPATSDNAEADDAAKSGDHGQPDDGGLNADEAEADETVIGKTAVGLRLPRHLSALRAMPDEALHEQLFELYLARLELRAVETELEEAVATADSAMAAEEEGRLLSLARDVGRRRAIFTDRERELADALAAHRRARRRLSLAS